MKPVDLKYFNDSLRLMAGRMGYNSQPAFNTSPQQGINDMAAQLQFNGGYPQQNRMIKDKRRSLDKAVLYSYQGAFVKKIYNPDVLLANTDIRNGTKLLLISQFFFYFFVKKYVKF